MERVRVADVDPGSQGWEGTSPVKPEDTYPEALVVEQVTWGDAQFAQSGRDHHVIAGDIFLIHPGVKHRYATGPSGILHKRYIEIRGPLLPALLRTMGLMGQDTIRPAHPGAVTAVMRRVFALLSKTAPDWPDKLSLAAHELLILLRKNLPHRRPSTLITALAFIERNLSRTITHAELCAHTGLSSTHLCRLFNTHVGSPPMRFLANQRMAWAQRLLVDSMMSIKEIAAAVGYDDQLYFSAQFKRHNGMSPKAYRMRSVSSPER